MDGFAGIRTQDESGSSHKLKRRVRRHVKRLAADGWLRVIPTYRVANGKRAASHYALGIPAEALAAIPATAIKGMREEIEKAVKEVRAYD